MLLLRQFGLLFFSLQSVASLVSYPFNIRGGAKSGAIREIRNGRTSDGRRKLLSMKELFADKSMSGDGGRSRPPGLFSRDGVIKLVGATSVAYIGKQFFNGGRYDGEPDLTGKLAVVTGGNSGIGKETAIRLAHFGADVIIACRSAEKAEKAVKEIVDEANKGLPRGERAGVVSYLTVDLSNLRTIDSFVDQLKAKTDRLDILVNNAGVMAVPELRLTSDGFETHLGINHLGHFYLTNKLFELIKRAPGGARIINVSSEAHRIPGLDLADLNFESRPYEKWTAYGQSKLANVLFTTELDRRLREKGLRNQVLTVACHPGIVRTELGRYLIEGVPTPILIPFAALGYYFTKSPKQGAQTQIYLASEPKVANLGGSEGPGGLYFSDCKPKAASKEGQDSASAARLWSLSEKLTGSSFNV